MEKEEGLNYIKKDRIFYLFCYFMLRKRAFLLTIMVDTYCYMLYNGIGDCYEFRK